MSVEKLHALVGRQDYLGARFSTDFVRGMMGAAREVSEQAVSYRGFKVGAVAAVLIPGTQEVILLRGTNNSPYQGAPKRCAEMHILAQVEQLANSGNPPVILDLFVAGPDDPTLLPYVNGIESSTLHPCADCRQLFKHNPAVNDETRVVTAGLNGDSAVEQHTVSELLARYEHVEPPPISSRLLQGIGQTSLERAA